MRSRGQGVGEESTCIQDCAPRKDVMRNGTLVKSTVETMALKKKDIIEASQLPKKYRYLIKSEFVLKGYRVNYETFSDCLYSLFSLHNQTLNAWTMIISLLVSIYKYREATILLADQPSDELLPFTMILVAMILHSPFSVAFHLFGCISEANYVYFQMLDFQFIMIGSLLLTYSLIYFPLACNYQWAIYAIMAVQAYVCVSTALALGSVEKSKALSKAQRVFRAGIAGVIYASPIVYSVFANWSEPNEIFWVSSKILFSMLGMAFTYVDHFPERYLKPGATDMLFQSHIIMHVFHIICHGLQFDFIMLSWQQYNSQPCAL
eukprot:Nk52_evm52s270 gene=Nk52_evmTU52s270